MTFGALDRWIPRIGLVAMVALAIGLVGTGFALYGPKAAPQPAATAAR